MTDPVETLARALTAMWYDGRDDRLTEHTYDKARALLAQITPALVAEAVAKEREACADLAQQMAQMFHEASHLSGVTDAEVALRRVSAQASLLVEMQIKMRGGDSHKINTGAAQ